MSDCMLRSADAVIDSTGIDCEDLIVAKHSGELNLLEVKVTHGLADNSDLTENCSQSAKNQIANSQEVVIDPPHISNHHSLADGSNANSNDQRWLRKSQSALMLITLPLTGDCCATCSQKSSDSLELKQQVKKLQEDLKRKEEQCENLTHVQLQTGQEVEELTATLFEEANKMVQDANIRRMTAERSLTEANNRIEVLQAEVTALKALVQTSSTDKPSSHLNPQINKAKNADFRGHRRSTSYHSFMKDFQQQPHVDVKSDLPAPQKPKPAEELESETMKAFRLWRLSPSLDASSTFLAPIVFEDIQPCLNFANAELSKKVYDGIFNNTVSVEPLFSQKMDEFQRCALSEMDTTCLYCFKLGDFQTPFTISKTVRNRIIAVCDFVTYMRYIIQGLVKNSDKEVFGEVLQLRKKMCLARLGLEE